MTDGYVFETPPPGTGTEPSTGHTPDGGAPGEASGFAIGAILAIAVALLIAIVLVWLRCRGGDGGELLVSAAGEAARTTLALGVRS